jgi:hypothetical protein
MKIDTLRRSVFHSSKLRLHSRKAQPLYLPLGARVSYLGVGAFNIALADHACIDSGHKQAQCNCMDVLQLSFLRLGD